MNLTEKTLWAELKFRILESAMMIQDGSTNDEVIANLMKVIEILDNTEPREVSTCSV